MTKRDFLISVLVVFVQYYDYHLFGFIAANIAIHFFPTDVIIIQLLNTYLVMTLAMIAKPCGAIILGKIGDIKGRSNSFKLSLIGTSIASLILFLTPSYATIGITSTLLIFISRMIICALVSSGSDGVRLYIYEHLPKSRQCLGIGLTTIFTQGGSLAASLAAWLFSAKILPDYYWRLTFLLGSIMALIVLSIIWLTKFTDNIKITTTVEFDQYKNSSIKKLIIDNWQLFALCSLLAGAIGSTNQFILVFFGTYNFKILSNIDQASMQNYISFSIVVYMTFSLCAGYLADIFSRYYLTVIGAFLTIIFALLQAMALYKERMNPGLYFLMVASLPFITMPAAAIFKESIPISIRYRVFSLSHAVGSIIISAPTAFICTWIYFKTNNAAAPFMYFIITILMISWTLYKLHKPLKNIHDPRDLV